MAEVVLEPYERYRMGCEAAAETFERLAERLRSGGFLSDAHTCSQHALRLRYLAEPDEEVRRLFNVAAAADEVDF